MVMMIMIVGSSILFIFFNLLKIQYKPQFKFFQLCEKLLIEINNLFS